MEVSNEVSNNIGAAMAFKTDIEMIELAMRVSNYLGLKLVVSII